MLFANQKNFAELLNRMLQDSFLKKVVLRYHYGEDSLTELNAVAMEMQKAMEKEAAFACCPDENSAGKSLFAVITLGKGVDKLQDNYAGNGMLTESYMVEALGSEILLQAYEAFNKWIEESTEYHVKEYSFLGDNKENPLEKLPDELKKISLPVECNSSCFMTPKKSVAFYAKLTTDKNVHCVGVCENCARGDCPNKTRKENLLPYGYARILGRNYL